MSFQVVRRWKLGVRRLTWPPRRSRRPAPPEARQQPPDLPRKRQIGAGWDNLERTNREFFSSAAPHASTSATNTSCAIATQSSIPQIWGMTETNGSARYTFRKFADLAK